MGGSARLGRFQIGADQLTVIVQRGRRAGPRREEGGATAACPRCWSRASSRSLGRSPRIVTEPVPYVISAAIARSPDTARVSPATGERAEMTYGTGAVTIVGFDPATDWIADSKDASTPLWRRLLPARAGTTTALNDDGQLVSAIWNLPSLALPPIGGLIALLFGYILLIGPVNYLVLRWLDRREWAWVTIPTLIAVFTVGAFGFGNALRGSDLIVHEIAIVRGAPAPRRAWHGRTWGCSPRPGPRTS